MKRKVIAVTGGIGSGKSTVCRLLEKKGFRVVDCDALSRRVAEQARFLWKFSCLLPTGTGFSTACGW